MKLNHTSKNQTVDELVQQYYTLGNAPLINELDFQDRMEKAAHLIGQAIDQGVYFYRRALESSRPQSFVSEYLSGEQQPTINLASNDYLGFTQHPEVIQAGKEALGQYGAGSGSVPMLSGTLTVHKQLEERLAAFLGYEDCLLFNSGFAANYGVLSALLKPGDVVILDSLVHASIIDGCAHARKLFFLHNDPDSLERALKKSAGAPNQLVVVDGVYSMDGDIARLREIKEVARAYGAYLMVDDAHGIGVLGPQGRGTQHHLDMVAEADLITGSFGKALAGVGGFVCGRRPWMQYLELMSRPFLFSSSIPPAVAAAIIKEIELLEAGDERLHKLWENTCFFSKQLRAMGFDLGLSETPILPVIIKDEIKVLEMCRMLHRAGIFVNPIIYPVVSRNKSRLRISLTAGLSGANLEYCLEKMEECGKQAGVI